MSRTRFLDKTLRKVAGVAGRFLFSDEYAQIHGLLQALDVRIKLLSLLLVLVLISLVHTREALWMLYGLSLGAAALSRVPLGIFIKRVWLFVPLFSAAVVLPALLNVVTPGEPVLVILRLDASYTWGPYTIPQEISITRQGLWGGITFLSRVAASVSFAVLFTMTSKWADIFAGLRALFVPNVLVITLSMAYRYIFVFLRLIQDMYLARKSRTITPASSAFERGWTASRIGFTFRRSFGMIDDIYKAMLSRGFSGEFRILGRFRAKTIDYVYLMTVVFLGGILLFLERGVRL